VSRHIGSLRAIWLVAMGTVLAAVAAGIVLPRLRAASASPATVTLVAVAVGVWIAFTAERDARMRLERVKRAYAAHGELDRLLRDHRGVLAVVLLRLEVVVVAGVLVAVWGMGPSVGVWITLLGGVMIALTWPSSRKTMLLIDRARVLRGDGPAPGR
jgi:hypothetical protein